MWNEFIAGLHTPGRVEFGMHQLERNERGIVWRRHDGRSPFENLYNALFSNKGAYAACTGTSDYPRTKYSATGRLIVPYVAAWVHGGVVAVLVRAAIPFPEAVLINRAIVDDLSLESDAEALQSLACIFGRGAEAYGVRWLTNAAIEVPVNLR